MYHSSDVRLRRTRLALAAMVVLFLGMLLFAAGDARAAGAGSDRSPWSVSISLSTLGLGDDDMERTYGLVPAFGARIAIPFNPTAEFFAGALYVTDSGNPFYDQGWTFSSAEADLRAVPLEFGVRILAVMPSNHRFYLGAAVQYIWIEETIPGADQVYAGDANPSAAFSGWGWGPKILVGPEFRFASGKWAAGMEFSLGSRSAIIQADNRQREASLSGLETRAYLALYF